MNSPKRALLALMLLLPMPLRAQRAAMPPADVTPASPQPVTHTDTFTVASAALGRERTVFVSLPSSHARTTRTYPVVVVLDGEAGFTPATSIAATLASLGHFPEAIVVGIPNATSDWNDRVHDMTPPGLSVSGSSLDEGGDRFLDFIEKELLPAIDSRYRGGRPRMLVGHSSGGVIVTHAAATRTATFPVIISIDAPIHLGDEWLAERLTQSARTADAPPLRYVSLETRFGWPDEAWSDLTEAAPDSWRLHREKLVGESHESMVFLALYQGMKFAFSDYSVVGAPLVPRASASSAFAHYAQLGASLGAELPPPARALRQMVEDLLIEGRVDDARRAYAWMVEGYGTQAGAPLLQTQIERVAGLPPLRETVDSLKATPLPTARAIAPYVGEWRGHNWMNPAAKSPSALRIRMEGERVIGEIVNWNGGVEHVSPLEYLRVTSDGLEFGRMNGMRPLGMLVHEGVRNGNALEGQIRFRGVVFPLPGGDLPGTIYFRYEKM